MAGLRDIRRRIKSIQGTRKITRAMQLVSAAKMRKSQNAVLASRSYASVAQSLAGKVADLPNVRAELFRTYPKAQKAAVLMLSTNRGLVGSLNTNLFSQLKKLEADEAGAKLEFITYGKKVRQTARRLDKKVIADFEKSDRAVSVRDVYPITKLVTSLYKSGEYKKVFIIYNHFYSTLSQKSTVSQILPFKDDLITTDEAEDFESDYFEPSPAYVLGNLLPRIVESRIYQDILESNASEHSARMVMMKNATDAAGDLISDLTLTYNQLRQAKITTELAEITSGKIALENP